MTTVTRNNETLKIEDNKTELYRSCGWTVLNELFTFKTKEDEDSEWMARFGD
tara:strand:- start:210 stop:365 length:156 start_codon:yes stop_codon:yes gene_type:complete